jgi:hypothetical protein
MRQALAVGAEKLMTCQYFWRGEYLYIRLCVSHPHFQVMGLKGSSVLPKSLKKSIFNKN